MSRYSEILIDHARHPHNFGRDSQASVIGRANLDGRPPEVEIYLRLKDDLVDGATFHAMGCGVTIAAASMITEMLRGRSLSECMAIGVEQLDQMLETVPSDKKFCLQIAVAASRNAVEEAMASGTRQAPRNFTTGDATSCGTCLDRQVT